MAFEIKVLLTADIHRGLNSKGRFLDFGFRLTAPECHRFGDKRRAVLPRTVDIRPMGEVAVLDLRKPCCTAGLVTGLGKYGKDRLAVELDEIGCQQRFVMLAG
ncbi:hypothetical protein D3C80_848420 [compost metagenome]